MTCLVCVKVTQSNDVYISCNCTNVVPCTLFLGCVTPLLEVALRQIPPLLSTLCFSWPCSSQPLLDIISPPSFGSSPRSLSVSHLPLCASDSPSIIFHACYMSCPFPFQFCYFFQDIIYFCSLIFLLLVWINYIYHNSSH